MTQKGCVINYIASRWETRSSPAVALAFMTADTHTVITDNHYVPAARPGQGEQHQHTPAILELKSLLSPLFSNPCVYGNGG